MNTSQFMDKQIMDLSNSQSNNDFINLINTQEDHIGGGKNEEIVPSYDFQPIRPTVASQPPSNFDSINSGGARVWNSADSKTNASGFGVRNYSSHDSIEPAKSILEKDHNVSNAALLADIDRTMKKHADNLLHGLEGISARLSQLESRTRHLENSLDDLKFSVGENNGSADGKMRQLENILREVQADVHVIRDKQEIVEAQLQLAVLQVSKVEHQSEAQSTVHVDSVHQAPSAPQHSHQHIPPVSIMQPPPGLPPPNAPLPPPSQQNLPPPVQLQSQFQPNQIPSVPQRESYFPPPGQTQDAVNQQFQPPPPQQLPPPPPQQPYQHPPHQQYSSPPPPPQQHPSLSAMNTPPPLPQPQPQPPLGHHHEEAQYAPSQTYPPSLRQPLSQPPPPSGPPPSQQFYGTPPHMYEPPSSRPGPGFSPGYGPSGPGEQYPYGGPPSHYSGGSSMKPQQLSSPTGAQSGGTGYPQLPTARILPQALPTASGVGTGSSSAGTGNRVPLDDVIDKVTTMGFSRDQVRATVRKLTENGQSVDLNVVLDKLMNDGDGQPPRAWFGR